MVIDVPFPKTHTHCKFLNRFKGVKLTVAAYSSSGLIQDFQHCGIVGVSVAFAIEDAHLLPSFVAHFQERLGVIQTPRYL